MPNRFLRPPILRTPLGWFPILFCLGAVLWSVVVSAQQPDRIEYLDADGRTQTATGRVIDMNAESMQFQPAAGPPRTIEAEQVVKIETAHLPEELEADRLFAARQYEQALGVYRQVAAREKRPWLNRRILARAVYCYENLNQPVRAAEIFVRLCGEEPKHRFYDAAPLVWRSARLDAEQQQFVDRWLEQRENPAAALIAASWAYGGKDRAKAVAVLNRLAGEGNPALAALARGQLWRGEVVTASAAQAEKWGADIEKMPPAVRAGPYYLLGQLWARLDQPERAVADLMRVPTVYPENRALAGEALSAAITELKKLQRDNQAEILSRELQRDYPDIHRF